MIILIVRLNLIHSHSITYHLTDTWTTKSLTDHYLIFPAWDFSNPMYVIFFR